MKNLHCHIALFVAAHKPDFVIHDEVHTPIHVGRVVSKFKAEMAEMLGDNTGENISEKNPSYCEMTAHYWIWKNVKDAEFVGLCHYRRYFGCEITQENISSGPLRRRSRTGLRTIISFVWNKTKKSGTIFVYYQENVYFCSKNQLRRRYYGKNEKGIYPRCGKI